MTTLLALKCIISGFLLAAPIGPVNLLCIQTTLQAGRARGLIIGWGAAAADMLYGYAAAAGLQALTAFLLQHAAWFRIGGGLCIIYLGLKTLRPPTDRQPLQPQQATGRLQLFTEVFLLTLANPVTVFTFLAVFSSLGISGLVTSYTAQLLAALGVFIGSALWWLTLTSCVAFFQHKITPVALHQVNRIFGLFIIGLGVVSLLGFI